MLRFWRPLALAAVCQFLFASAAAAQTVIVTHAPPGDKIEVILAGKPAGSAIVDSSGVATVPINLQAATGAAQTKSSESNRDFLRNEPKPGTDSWTD